MLDTQVSCIRPSHRAEECFQTQAACAHLVPDNPIGIRPRVSQADEIPTCSGKKAGANTLLKISIVKIRRDYYTAPWPSNGSLTKDSQSYNHNCHSPHYMYNDTRKVTEVIFYGAHYQHKIVPASEIWRKCRKFLFRYLFCTINY